MADDETNRILVLDRQRADFDQCAWSMRRMLTDIGENGFAKWVASPDRGRFIVVALAKGFTAEQTFSFADNEDELIDLVHQRLDEMPARNLNLDLCVMPDLRKRFDAG